MVSINSDILRALTWSHFSCSHRITCAHFMNYDHFIKISADIMKFSVELHFYLPCVENGSSLSYYMLAINELELGCVKTENTCVDCSIFRCSVGCLSVHVICSWSWMRWKLLVVDFILVLTGTNNFILNNFSSHILCINGEELFGKINYYLIIIG